MAARKAAARFLTGTGPPHARYHGRPCAPISPRLAVTAVASHLPSVCLLSRHSHDVHPPRRSFSSEGGPSDAPAKKGKRSPHSKLLRVCSERNANPHFAAIEAEMLRLNWKEAMDLLVEDWTQSNRWDDLVELERNVRAYVLGNLTDLRSYHIECAEEWERSEELQSVTLADHLLRAVHFPYEAIITKAAHHALSGTNFLSPSRLEELRENENKIANAELRERIMVLSKAGKLLDAMARFEEVVGSHMPDAESMASNGWTEHHTSCSNCHKSVVAGWFLLHRRQRELNERLIAEADASDILAATTKSDVHPEHEAYVWAKRWMEFCKTSNGGQSDDQEAENGGTGKSFLRGGISSSEKPLLLGIAKMLSMSENARRQKQSIELKGQIEMLFGEE